MDIVCKTNFDDLGLSYIWRLQIVHSPNYLKHIVSIKLKNINLQSWKTTLDKSSKGTTYTIFKNESLNFENYLNMKESIWRTLLKFRTSNHNLPIETGRWKKIPITERKCTLCPLT